MTPQELAVIQAAMEWRYAILANPHGQAAGLPPAVLETLTTLGTATYQLAISCPECNAGGHTCPGDGDHIPHGATDCGNHDDVRREIAQVDPVLVWVERTWVDVRTGDQVRMPGTDVTAHVQNAMLQRWHVDPRSSEYRPEALEWSAVRVLLDGGKAYDMDPAKPVEIEIDEATFHMLNALGWENRVGMITS